MVHAGLDEGRRSRLVQRHPRAGREGFAEPLPRELRGRRPTRGALSVLFSTEGRLAEVAEFQMQEI